MMIRNVIKTFGGWGGGGKGCFVVLTSSNPEVSEEATSGDMVNQSSNTA